MRFKDLTKEKFTRLKVLSYAGKNKDGRALWLCRCDCGKEKIISAKTLLNGDSKSCGCYKADGLVNFSKSHGDSHTLFYRIWKSMRQRCDNPKDKSFKNYGSRGINYDTSWNDYEKFKEDMYELYLECLNIYGQDEHPSIERKNNNGNYSKENCIFIPRRNQNKNKRSNKWFLAIDPKGNEYISKNQSEFARQHNLVQSDINRCLNGIVRKQHNGWTFEFINIRRKIQKLKVKQNRIPKYKLKVKGV